VATIQGVRVLNLNDVANSLKPALIPGEQLSLRLIKPGEQPSQGVGYLDDGTMVVAEDGRAYVGQQVTLTVTSTLQTSAGRLLFGRVVDAGDGGPARVAEPGAEGGTGAEAGNGAEAAADGGHAPEPAHVAATPGPVHVAPPEAERRGPFPPKPPSKRVNPFRNPRR
jgi:hypothetical protein